MAGDRIKSRIKIGYSAKNSRGVETLGIDAEIRVADQSPAAASRHLVGIMNGAAAPAIDQAAAKKE